MSKPVSKLTLESVSKPTLEPMSKPTLEPTLEPTLMSKPKPISEPTPNAGLCEVPKEAAVRESRTRKTCGWAPWAWPCSQPLQ